MKEAFAKFVKSNMMMVVIGVLYLLLIFINPIVALIITILVLLFAGGLIGYVIRHALKITKEE